MRWTALFALLLLAGAPWAWGQAPATPLALPEAPKLPEVPAPTPYPLPAPAPAAAPAEGAPPPTPLVPLDQVQIQVWISETNEQGLRDVGANLRYTRVVRGVPQSGSLQQVDTTVFNEHNQSYGVTLPAPDQTVFPPPLRPDLADGPGNGIQTTIGGGLVANIISPGYGTIEGVFRGIEQKSDIDLISKPEILVINNGMAEIHAGGQVPYQNISYTAYGVPQLNVTWQDLGVNLKLQPLILNNDTVKINITELGVTDVVRIDNIRGIDLPVFAKRAQTGEVIVPNGQTLVVGGLSSRIVQKSERRVPIVGRIPLVGIAFRGRTSRASNAHLLIFVSPTIVNLRTLTPEATDALQFWKNARWENRDRIEREVAIMQEEP